MRIVQPAAKIGTVLLGLIVTLLAFLAVGLSIGNLGLAGAFGLVGTLVTTGWCVRTFRGESEDREAPRPWWRLTERPLAGYLVALLFVAQAIGVTGTSAVPAGVRVTAAVVYAIVAVGFFASSMRLRRTRHHGA